MKRALAWIDNGKPPKILMDGDVLDPESLVEDNDIESGDTLEVKKIL